MAVIGRIPASAPGRERLCQSSERTSSPSPGCDVRFEDRSLLADLQFAVLEVARALVNVQDSPGGSQLCIDKPEAARGRAFAEQALTGAEDYGELPDAQRIDKVALE